MGLEEASYLVLVSSSAIGIMMALQELVLDDLIRNSPILALIGFVALMASAGKISERVFGGR